VLCPISIETMPILHFYPGGKFLQASTAGCNFDCSGCISTVIVREMDPNSKAMKEMSASEVIAEAKNNDCLGIAFLMNDPLASFLTFLQVAREAKKEGMLVGCSSNAYFTEYSLSQLSPCLDFINIGLKGLHDKAYHSCGGRSVQPVLRNLKILYQDGVHIEVSCIAEQDNRQEILSLARLIADISKDIPLQIMRFIPLEKADPAREISIRDAESLVEELKKLLIMSTFSIHQVLIGSILLAHPAEKSLFNGIFMAPWVLKYLPKR